MGIDFAILKEKGLNFKNVLKFCFQIYESTLR